MTPRQIELHCQRGRLLERIAHQRVTLAEQMQPLLEAERLGRRGLDAASATVVQLKAHPLAVAVALSVFTLFKPKRVWRGLRLSLWIWRRYRHLKDLLPPSLRAAFASRHSD